MCPPKDTFWGWQHYGVGRYQHRGQNITCSKQWKPESNWYIDEVINPIALPHAQQVGQQFIFQQDNAKTSQLELSQTILLRMGLQ